MRASCPPLFRLVNYDASRAFPRNSARWQRCLGSEFAQIHLVRPHKYSICIQGHLTRIEVIATLRTLFLRTSVKPNEPPIRLSVAAAPGSLPSFEPPSGRYELAARALVFSFPVLLSKSAVASSAPANQESVILQSTFFHVRTDRPETPPLPACCPLAIFL